MTTIGLSPFALAGRFVGLKEVGGVSSNPLILAMLRLDEAWPAGDSVPWCSAFVNFVAWLLRLPRSKSLGARSWLLVGTPVALEQAVPGWDVVILSRGIAQPGPEVTAGAAGHVGFFGGVEGKDVIVLSGNQADSVSLARYPVSSVLGVRRLYTQEKTHGHQI